ncbi:Hypothetical predicted protein, partial [Pelobates cultripes]
METQYRRRGARGGTFLQKRKERKTSKQNGIFNLSQKELTKPQMSLLAKGLKFAPTKPIDKFSVYLDLNRFKRKLCLKNFFFKHPVTYNPIGIYESDIIHTDLKENSIFFPRHFIFEEMTTFEKMVMSDINKIKKPKS